MSRAVTVGCAALLALWAGFYYLARGVPSKQAAPPTEADPIAAKKQELFALAAARPADAELVALYADINQRHFGGALPAIPVMWDDALKEVDGLIGDGQHLHGMTNGRLMLVSTELKDNPDELRRTVCHETVHVKLHAPPATTASHDEVFQAELRRLFDEACFVAILASQEEQDALHRWIAEETTRLTEESAHLDLLRARLNAERREVERAIADLNARAEAARARQSGWPTEEEVEDVNARREHAIQETADFNTALEHHAAAAAELNREIERYRLMVAYPHGIDEEVITRRGEDRRR